MSTSAPPPVLPPAPGHLPFMTVFGRTASVIVNLTAIVVLAKEMPTWLEEAPQLGWRVASMRFGLEFLVQATILSIVNTLLVALPVAGAIYYFRFLAERRSP